MNRLINVRQLYAGFLVGLSCFLLILIVLPASVPALEAPIINGKQKMAPGEQQVLSIWNYQTGNTYTWSRESGAGTLSAGSGESVVYEAPTSNQGCNGNPTIRVTDSSGQYKEIQIAFNSWASHEHSAYFTFDNGYCDDLGWGWICGYDEANYNCFGEVLSKVQRGTTVYRIEGDCSACYNKAPQVGFYPDETVQWHLDNSPADNRSSYLIENGCCPEALLPTYEPQKTANTNVYSGNDTNATCPERNPDQVGNPISIYNGNNFETQEDLRFPSPGGEPFEFRRHYNSKSGIIANIGYGWIHNFKAFLNPNYEYSGDIYLRILDETGRGVYFEDQGSGSYTGAYKERTYVQVESGDYVWYRLDGRRFVFNSAKKLIRIEEPSGNHRTLTYDTSNRLKSVIDEASGRTLTFNYNSASRIESISGPVTPAVPGGIWLQYGYDANGNLTSVTYADNSGFDYEYNDPNDVHNLTAKKNKSGHLLSSWTYDIFDRAISSFTRDGKGVDIDYISENKVHVTDAYGIVRTYTIWEIDGRKKVTDIAGPSGCTSCSDDIVRIEYDSQGRVIEVEYANGLINQYDDFDSRGNARIFRKAVGTPDEKTIIYTYHPEISAKLSRTEPSLLGAGNKVTIWDYDSDGNDIYNENPTRKIHKMIERGFTREASGSIAPYEIITAYTYNAKGQVISYDGPQPGSQDTTAYEYAPSSGDLLAATRPLVGSVVFSGYDGAGQSGRVIDENGNATVYAYDGRGRVKSVTRETDGATTTYEYSLAGELARVTDPDGVSTDLTYDALYGRLTHVMDPLENYIQYEYDDQGNRIEQSIENPSNEVLFLKRFSYQNPVYPGKLWKEINPDNTYIEYSYDAGGNVQTVTDPAGRTTFYDYDQLNRLATVTQPGNAVTTYDYDIHNNLASLKDAEDHTTSYSYDDLGRMLSTVSPDTNTATYAYDSAGNLILKTDAKGITTGYTYDALNRLFAVKFPDASQNIFYFYDEGPNSAGRLSRISDSSGTVSYEYDHNGQLVRETKTINGFDFTTQYVYTQAGRVAAIVYPNGRIINYSYDAAGQTIKVVSLFDGVETTLADNIMYLPFGPVTAMQFGNGLAADNRFDQLYRLTASQTGTVENHQLTYDPTGNITAIDDLLEPGRSQIFSYDKQNQLTDASGVYGNIGFTYDRVGNRLSKTSDGTIESYTYTPGTSRLSNVDGTAYTYDANGNTIGMGSKTLTYNQNNRLIQAAENGVVLGEYVYNALGQRTVKRVDGATTGFIYDSQGNLIAEADESGNIVNEYFYLNGRLLAAVKSGKMLIEAMVDIDPDTLNLNCKGNWITAYIQLPEEYDASLVDPATITLNQSVFADRVQVGDHDGDGIPDLMVKFDRDLVSDILETGDEVIIQIDGQIAGIPFAGTDTIRVIDKGKKNKKRQSTATAAQTVAAFSTALKTSRIIFYHLDHLGTPQVMTDESGAVVWQADYMPFGSVNATVTDLGNKFRFPGQYYDQETGLHYNYHRYYDPKTGRYLTPDPIGLEGGINPYLYAGSNPINLFDLMGLVSWEGSSFQISAVSLVGATFIRYELESECVNGKKAKIIVWAVGPSGGLGARATATWSRARFEDYDNQINVDNFSGLFMGVSAGITGHPGVPIRPPGTSLLPGKGPSIGISGIYVRLGNAFSKITDNPGIIAGYDKSITGTIGSSTVVESKILNCCEDK